MKNNIITNPKKSKKLLLIVIIVSVAALFFLLVLMYFSRHFGMNYILYHILDDFDDIVETLFKLSLTVAIIIFLVVFFKKIWHKL